MMMAVEERAFDAYNKRSPTRGSFLSSSRNSLFKKMSRQTLWSTADMDEDLADAVDVELSMYAQQGHNSAVYDHLGAQIEQLEPLLAIQQHMAALAAVPDVVKSVGASIVSRETIQPFYTVHRLFPTSNPKP